MMVYGYQQIAQDRLNQLIAIIPRWRSIPMEEILKLGIGSLAPWNGQHAGRYFARETDGHGESYGKLASRFSEMTIKVKGNWKHFKNLMIVFRNPGGLYQFLKSSWKPGKDDFQQELYEMVLNSAPTAAVLNMLANYFEVDGWRHFRSEESRPSGGVVEYSELESHLELFVLKDGSRCFFKQTDCSQLALREMHHKRNGHLLPVSSMLWGAQGLREQSGPFVSFWRGKTSTVSDLSEIDEVFVSAMEKSHIYSGAPWLPTEDECLQARAILRIPPRHEVLERLREGSEKGAENEISNNQLVEINSIRIRALVGKKLPPGLPAGGFIRDSRSPIHIPEGIPLLSDVGDVLAVLARTDHELFISDRPPRPSLRLLPRTAEPLWAVIAVPVAPLLLCRERAV